MTKISKALKPIIDSGTSKYKLAKILGVSPIMVNNYLKDKVLSPKFEVCKSIYDRYNVVVFPYTEEELQSKNEQLIIEFK